MQKKKKVGWGVKLVLLGSHTPVDSLQKFTRTFSMKNVITLFLIKNKNIKQVTAR